jgi:hypothetical protein
MKKFFALPLAVVFAAACSESTSPASSDLSPDYARPTGGGDITVAGNLQSSTFTFGAGDYTSISSGQPVNIAYEESSGAPTASIQTEDMPSHASDYVLGRLNNQRVVISVAAGATKYWLDLDLFLIGSWDGRGQQAQHGNFGQDSWQVAAMCGTSLVDIFTTSFSNQKTVQQNYPRSIYDGGGSTWLSGADGTNFTGFSANVPLFDAVVDSRYDLTFSGLNPCPAGQTFSAIVLSIPNFDLQTRFDESWAVDNLTLKTDS